MEKQKNKQTTMGGDLVCAKIFHVVIMKMDAVLTLKMAFN